MKKVDCFTSFNIVVIEELDLQKSVGKHCTLTCYKLMLPLRCVENLSDIRFFGSLTSSILCTAYSKWVIETQKRTTCPEVFCKKGVLKIFSKFSWKHLCWSFLFDKVAGLSPATLSKKIGSDTAGAFLWILRNFYKHFFIENPRWLLLSKTWGKSNLWRQKLLKN